MDVTTKTGREQLNASSDMGSSDCPRWKTTKWTVVVVAMKYIVQSNKY